MKVSDNHISSIFEAIKFVEANLKEEITISDIADAIGYSLYHFCRTFNAVVNITPYDFLIKRRLSQSTKDLITTDSKIIEIAFDYQFRNPETYSRAFRKMFGILPTQYRKNLSYDEASILPPLSHEYLLHIHKNKPAGFEEGHFPNTTFTGYVTFIDDDQKDIIDLWKRFTQSIKEKTSTDNLNYYGMRIFPEHNNQNRFFYFACVKADNIQESYFEYVTKEIISSAFFKIVHHGNFDKICFTLDYLRNTKQPIYQKISKANVFLEDYGKTSPDEQFSDNTIDLYFFQLS